jgi:hypothetical protein
MPFQEVHSDERNRCPLSTERTMDRYEIQKVGGDHHTECWIPAEDLDELNENIVGITAAERTHAEPMAT